MPATGPELPAGASTGQCLTSWLHPSGATITALVISTAAEPPALGVAGTERLEAGDGSGIVVRPAGGSGAVEVTSDPQLPGDDLTRFAFGIADARSFSGDQLAALGELVDELCCDAALLDGEHRVDSLRVQLRHTAGPLDPRRSLADSRAIEVARDGDVVLTAWTGRTGTGAAGALVACGGTIELEDLATRSPGEWDAVVESLVAVMREALPCVLTTAVPVDCLGREDDPPACGAPDGQ